MRGHKKHMKKNYPISEINVTKHYPQYFFNYLFITSLIILKEDSGQQILKIFDLLIKGS